MNNLTSPLRNFSEEKTRKSFSKVIWIYDFWSNLTEKKALSKALELADISPGERVLDVGTGTGVLLKEIVKLNPNGLNAGIDLSPAMLEKAQKRLTKNNTGHYELKIGNAYQLPFEDSSFDLLFNNYMLDLLPEKDFENILNEFYRVLKPDGRIVITSMSFGERWYSRFWYYVAKWFPQLMTYCRPISLKKIIGQSKFRVLKSREVIQNTFPSMVVLASKN